jgi:hypothetical protein
MALPALCPDGLQPGDGVVGQEFATHIAGGHKREVVDQLLLAGGQLGGVELAARSRQFGVAPQDLEAQPHFVDAVADGFQLGGLVDDVLGLVTLPQSCSQAPRRKA